MGITENSTNQVTNPEMQGNSPTPRGTDPILDRRKLGEEPAPRGAGPAARDSDNGASKEARDMGNNGNPAQSTGRPTAAERNENPAPLNEASEVTEEA